MYMNRYNKDIRGLSQKLEEKIRKNKLIIDKYD